MEFPDIVGQALNSRKLALFLGAGASSPSGLPTAPQIVSATVDALKKSLRTPLTCASEFGPSFPQRMRIEYLCRTLAEVDPRLGLMPLSPLVHGEPTSIHYFAAACAKSGHVRYIVTTNFDLLIERALDALRVPYVVVCTEEDYARVDECGSPCVLVKLHGSMDAGTGGALPGIVADIRVVGKGLGEARVRTLGKIARQHSLLFLGYSGRDYFGAMPILFASSPQPVYWADHVPSETQCSDSVRRWVLAGTGGRYAQVSTGEFLQALARQAGITYQADTPIKRDIHYTFPDRMSELERAFALTWLYSRDLEGNVQILHRSFEDCEKLFPSDSGENSLLPARIYRCWVSTMERVGRTSAHVGAHARAVELLNRALSMVPPDSALALDIEVALCDFQFRVDWLRFASGVEYLPLIEMLIDRCVVLGDQEILARAYSTKSGICQNALGKMEGGVAMAIEAMERSAEALEVLGAQDMLPVCYFQVFKLALALGQTQKAASALVKCISGMLLTARSPSDTLVTPLVAMARQMAEKPEYKDTRETIARGLSALGIDGE